MKGYLLDTNVLSELLRKRPEPAVVARLRTIPATQLFSCDVCVMELRFGAARQPKRRLWTRIEKELLPLLRILPFDTGAALQAGDVLAALERNGTPIGVEDVMIGSIALDQELIVATRNVRHLARIDGLTVENFWEGTSEGS